jgi:hypothetical protein
MSRETYGGSRFRQVVVAGSCGTPLDPDAIAYSQSQAFRVETEYSHDPATATIV